MGIQTVVKTGKFRFFFRHVAEFRIGILINFANPFCGNGMVLYSRHIMAAISRDAAATSLHKTGITLTFKN